MKFSHEFWRAEYQQGKTFADSATVSRDASQAKEKIEKLSSLFRDMVGTDVEIDRRTSLVRDSARHHFRAKSSKED